MLTFGTSVNKQQPLFVKHVGRQLKQAGIFPENQNYASDGVSGSAANEQAVDFIQND